MPLIRRSNGQARVRVMRVRGEGGCNEVRELSVQAMLGASAHPHSFILDSNGQPMTVVQVARSGLPTLDQFGLSADNMVFVATDVPHGQVECKVGRG